MTNLRMIVPALCAGLPLAGCGMTSDATVSAAAEPQFPTIYASNVRDGVKTSYSEFENGYVAFLGNADGTVSEHFVRWDSDSETLFVSTNGGPEVEYTEGAAGTTFADFGSSLAGTVANAEDERFYFFVTAHAGQASLRGFEAENGPQSAFGYGGIETAISDLPDSATYNGGFNTYAYGTGFQVVSTYTADMAVDFANGDISGTHEGRLYRGTGGAISGTITGTAIGSRVSGTLSVTGAATGDIAFGGMTQGEGAEYITGGVAGTVTDGDDAAFTGYGGYTLTKQ